MSSGPVFYEGIPLSVMLQRMKETQRSTDPWDKLLHVALQREISELLTARAAGWDEEELYQYSDLTPDSIVWDVGAFDGDFANQINQRFDCYVRLFEVLPRKWEYLQARFMHNEKIRILPWGLSNSNRFLNIRDDNNSTTLLSGGDLEIRVERASTALPEDTRIDLMKLNVEGAEFDIIEDLIDSGRISSVKHLLVQFHDMVVVDGIAVAVPNAYVRAERLAERLHRTHSIEWARSWIWESWVRK